MARRRYAPVERYVWRDPEFRALADDEKLLWLFLLTAPNLTANTGLLVDITSMVIADTLGWEIGRVSSALETLESLGWVMADERTRTMLLPRAVAHQLPENPNVVVGWSKTIHEVPNGQIKTAWIESTREALLSSFGPGDSKFKTFETCFPEMGETVPELFDTGKSGCLHNHSRIQNMNMKQNQNGEEGSARARVDAFTPLGCQRIGEQPEPGTAPHIAEAWVAIWPYWPLEDAVSAASALKMSYPDLDLYAVATELLVAKGEKIPAYRIRACLKGQCDRERGKKERVAR